MEWIRKYFPARGGRAERAAGPGAEPVMIGWTGHGTWSSGHRAMRWTEAVQWGAATSARPGVCAAFVATGADGPGTAVTTWVWMRGRFAGTTTSPARSVPRQPDPTDLDH